MSTLLRADGGTVTVNGYDPATRAAAVRASISLTGQFAAVDEILTGRENLELVAQQRHVADPRTVADDLLARFGLADAAGRRVATYSGGMRRRLDIAMSLIGKPPVIFLDEPTTGLDPQARIEVWKTVRELSNSGTTVFLTTQYLDEAEQLADRIAFLHAEPRRHLPRDRRARRGRHRGSTLMSPAINTHVGDTVVMLKRSLRHILRSPDTIMTTAITPVALLLMFVYVFGGAIDTGPGTDDRYVNYLLPGILLMTVASGVAYTAYRLFLDQQSGIFERFQSMPIARSATLWGHVLTSLVANLMSLALVVLVALPMRFRSGAGLLAWLAVVGILVLLTLAVTWLAIIAGLAAKSADGAGGFAYPLLFLPFVSSAFVPTEGMPGPVPWFAENQPVTSIVNTLRNLYAEQPVGNDGWIALAWCVGLLVLAYALAMRTYRRKFA
jgi:ABC-2 type transport system permease protein